MKMKNFWRKHERGFLLSDPNLLKKKKRVLN